MKCPSCGKLSLIHVGNVSDLGWTYAHYCDDCLSFHGRDERRSCPHCHYSLSDFFRTGHLGCQRCYDAFSPELAPLMDRHFFRKPGSTPGQLPGMIGVARARSQTITEILSDPWKRSGVIGNQTEDYTKERGYSRKLPDFSSFLSRGNEIPITLRLRAARNIPGLPYIKDREDARIHALNRLILGPKSGIVQKFLEYYQNRCDDPHRFQWGMADDESLRTLTGAGILPEHTIAATWFYPDPDRLMILYSGDEDHVRIQWIFRHISGERGLHNLHSTLGELDFFDSLMEWQFHPAFGYLASCPSNSGAGVRISFMLDLRGLILSGGFRKWKESLGGLGLDIRGDRGEGSLEKNRIQISAARFEYGENLEKRARNLLLIIKRLMKAERDVRKLKGIPCDV